MDTTPRQHRIKPPSEKPTATVRQDVRKYKRYRSVLHSDTVFGDGSCRMTVRHQEGFRASPCTGKTGICVFKASDQSSAKLTLIVNTREFCVGKNLRNSSGYSKRKMMFSHVRRDPLG